MAADGSIIIDTRLDTSGIDNGVSRIKQSFDGLGSAVKRSEYSSAVHSPSVSWYSSAGSA